MKNNVLYYSVGALLYCPANQKNIAASVISEKFGKKYSLALCLEDTIHDDFVSEAEVTMLDSLQKIFYAYQQEPFYLPKIFIRVRNAEQLLRISRHLGSCIEILTGFILPKFNPENADLYIQEIIRVNETFQKKIYTMPIYESSSMIDLRTRVELLYSLKESLSRIEELVLNIRVGGNDLCHMFGFRRHADESIHKISPISHIFADIITVYGMDYVISGPVWEYYGGGEWEKGLFREIREDQLCGFTGKTVIHPKQIPVVNHAYRVSRNDFNDAQEILNWNRNSNSYVSGSSAKERMNEYKTHLNWAEKTMYLAEAFGISE